MLKFTWLPAALLLIGVSGAQADEPLDYDDALTHMVNQVILPDHAALVRAATDFETHISAHCDTPTAQTHQKVKAEFADLVSDFAKIELYRFGPARTDNRFERLFFWPDRKGRALRHVQKLISNEDPSALSVESLRGKSVAVQGLPALDYLLFGTGSEILVEYRCRYAKAAAGAVRATAIDLEKGWQEYAKVMLGATLGNETYRNNGEVVGELLRAAAEQLEIINIHKLARPLGDHHTKAKPKRAPFWRSNLVIPSILSNLDAVERLIAHQEFADLLPDTEPGLVQEVKFDLAQVRSALTRDDAMSRPWIEVVIDQKVHSTLDYSRIPLEAAREVIGERFPVAFGLTMGFNSLDGD